MRFLMEMAEKSLPRILTQICRDPLSDTYGCCDRDWWHYKIRDFPSIILQQAGYTLFTAAQLQGWNLQPQCLAGITHPRQANHLSSISSHLTALAAATARFWNLRALRHGAFEEYYPYEQGYPPVAFSTLAVAKLCQEGVVPLSEIRPGLAIATNQLLDRFESRAANQQMAGTAALAVIRSLDPSLVSETRFQTLLTKSLALQDSEGWFPEYDGPDLGYLSVTIDCLYDIHDHTNDPRILAAIRKAAAFIAWFALSPQRAAGMLNSRNTDYITPYGLTRLALEERDPSVIATFHTLFTRESEHAFHFLDAIDDRYWSHYIGHSVFRACRLLESVSSLAPADEPLPVRTLSQPHAGYHSLRSARRASILVATRKGGILTATWPSGASIHDFGWTVTLSKRQFINHWWSPHWQTQTDEHALTIRGTLVPHREITNTPFKHIALRVASLLIGKRLIPLLKNLVIFHKQSSPLHFERHIRWEGESLIIVDRITNIPRHAVVTRSPRSSKRHVASADSYHPEDFPSASYNESIDLQDGRFQCETIYHAPEVHEP